MFKKTIDSKPLIRLEDGTLIKDLTVSIFNNGANTGQISYELFKAPASAACRPDLISILYYGTEEETEFVLKFNGISNPFRLNPGDIVMLPSKTDANNLTSGDLVSSYGDETGKRNIDYSKGPHQVKEKIRNSYKYINPDNIKEILSTPEKNKDFDKLRIPKGASVPYIAKDDTAVIQQDSGTGRFVITNKKPTVYNKTKLDDLAKSAASESCIDVDGETLTSVNKGKTVL